MIRNNDNPTADQNGNGGNGVGPESASLALPSSTDGLLQIAWQNRWLIILTVLVAVAGAFIYLMKATPLFTSTSRIYVEQSGPKIVNEMEEGVMTRSKNYLYTQTELLKSTPIIAAALEAPSINGLQTFASVDNRIMFLKNAMQAEVGKKDDIISVSFECPYPKEAAKLVNAVVDAYITYHAKTKRTTSAEVLKILQKEKQRRSQELSDRLRALTNFKRMNETLAFESNQGNIIIQRLERLSEVLTEAQLKTIDAKSEYDSAKKMVSDPEKLRQLVEAKRSTGAYVSRNSKRDQLESKLEELNLAKIDRLRKVKPDHPAVEAIDLQIAGIKEQLAEIDREFANAYLTAAEQEYLAAKDKETEVAKYFEEQRKDALGLNEELAEYTVLQSEYEQTKKLCDILDERIKELNITEDVGALNISILEVARAAEKPSSPQKTRLMAMAVVLGLMLGGGVAMLRSFLDQRLHSAEDVTALLGLPMLGVVPSMSKKMTVSKRGTKVHSDPSSPVAEAYRTVRTAVFFSVPKNSAKTILVTSPAAGDGKSTLISNLGIAMAQAGQRILVFDADFRKPMQHTILNADNQPGISSVIAGLAPLETAIQQTEIKGLDILPCGPDVPNPSELLNSDEFSEILSELASRYDRVLVDAPPVMPVTDACILGALCDVTLLVLRADKSTRKNSQQARDGLLSVGANVLGVIVNDVVRHKNRYGYYYGYGRYGYGKKQKKTADSLEAVAS